jgi:hypothetical protein
LEGRLQLLIEVTNMENKLFNLKIEKCVIVTVLLLGVLSCQSYQTNNEKTSNNYVDSRKVKIISLLQELSDVHYFNDNQIEENRVKIGKAIDKLENAEDLVTLALMSKTLAKNCLDVECFKSSDLRPTYENTYWEIAKKLATKKEENRKVLEDLKIRSQLSGTDIGDWDKIVEGKEFP